MQPHAQLCDATNSTLGVANLTNLQRLVLTSNQLTRVEDLTNLPALRHLLLQDNCLCTYQDLCLDMLVSMLAT